MRQAIDEKRVPSSIGAVKCTRGSKVYLPLEITRRKRSCRCRRDMTLLSASSSSSSSYYCILPWVLLKNIFKPCSKLVRGVLSETYRQRLTNKV